jgi:hypothetical protein
MHTVTPSVLLKRALLADAAVSAGSALLQLAATQLLVTALELPRLLLVGTAEFALVYAAVLALLATRVRLWSAAVKFIVVGNLAWGGLSLALLFTGALAPSSLGVAFVVLQAAAVGLLAGLQWVGLKASATGAAAWAAPEQSRRAHP